MKKYLKRISQSEIKALTRLSVNR